MTREHLYLKIFDDLIALYPVPIAQNVHEKYQRVAGLADGWYLHVHRGCLALVLLEQEGFQEETAPLSLDPLRR